jgi:hypothetical protein
MHRTTNHHERESANPTLDVEVAMMSHHMLFVSDRWGYLNESHYPTPESFQSEMGFASESAEKLLQSINANSNIFNEEDTFLILLKSDEEVARNSDPENRLALLMEFELSDEYLPRLHIKDNNRNAEAWKTALTFHSPAILALARAMAKIPQDPDDPIRLIFDLDGAYGGNISAVIPMKYKEHHSIIREAMWNNGIPFPPSSHDQVEAVRNLLWKYRPSEIPVEILPGTVQTI